MSIQQAIDALRSITDDDLASEQASVLYELASEAELMMDRAWDVLIEKPRHSQPEATAND